VSGVPSCASLATSGKTLDCLLKANTSEIFAGVNYAVANAGAFPFNPTLDGPNGLVPDIPSKVYTSGMFAKIPFISGTNLDEGMPQPGL
jgi:acetylcholinesterase